MNMNESTAPLAAAAAAEPEREPEPSPMPSPPPLPRLTEAARVVPWCDWDEWRRLRDDARGDTAARKRASETLAGWRLRRAAGMPVAIEADVSLRALRVVPARDRGYEWRLAVGMAVVRLVNGLTDQLQPKAISSTARSVRSLAVTLNLPSPLVAIRHQATHNNLPSADTLNQALELAIEWIDTHYWTAQDVAAGAQGPQSVGDLANVFRGDLWDGTLPTSPATGAPDASAGSDVLVRMQAVIPRLELAKNARTEEWNARTPGKRWRRCGNEQGWKFTPLGLCPWQTQVDSVHDYLDTEKGDVASEQSYTTHGSQGSGTLLIKKRRLNEDEVRFVNRRRNELLT